MTDEDRRPVAVGDRLPVSTVVTADGDTVLLRPSARSATILVLAHPSECEDCAAYLRALDEGSESLDRWAARPVAVTPDADQAGRLGYPAVHDDGALRRRFRAADEDVVVLVADRHGEVWATWSTPDHAQLPALDALGQEARFIAIQCPECEVPDTAALGEWAAAPGG